MRNAIIQIRNRLDRAGIILSGICAVHCILGIVLVGVLGLGGGSLLSPEIHHIGLVLALIVGVVSLGLGSIRHRHIGPLLVGALGLCVMAAALFVGHGLPESVLTIIGVALVAFAHIRNLRAGC